MFSVRIYFTVWTYIEERYILLVYEKLCTLWPYSHTRTHQTRIESRISCSRSRIRVFLHNTYKYRCAHQQLWAMRCRQSRWFGRGDSQHQQQQHHFGPASSAYRLSRCAALRGWFGARTRRFRVAHSNATRVHLRDWPSRTLAAAEIAVRCVLKAKVVRWRVSASGMTKSECVIKADRI